MKKDFDYHLVTVINQNTGNVNVARVPGKHFHSEKIAEKAFDKNELVVQKVSKGFDAERFLDQESTREWMVERIESLCAVPFDSVMMKGVPDYVVTTKASKKLSFVEVKSAGDGLRTSQLRWMRLFDSAPVKIAYVEKSDQLQEEVRS